MKDCAAEIRERDEAAASFDQKYQQQLTQVLGDVNAIRVTLALAALRAEPTVPSPWRDALALVNEAQATLVSSTCLVRQHAMVDAFALLRTAVERAAVAVHISMNDDAFRDYANDRYACGKAIGAASSQIPQLGPVWGSLSEAAIHPNVRLFGPRCDFNAPAVIRLFGRPTEQLAATKGLKCVSLVAALVLRASELTLLDELPGEDGWLQLPGGSMRVNAVAARLVERRLEEFTTLDA